jgi:hypothetical protein
VQVPWAPVRGRRTPEQTDPVALWPVGQPPTGTAVRVVSGAVSIPLRTYSSSPRRLASPAIGSAAASTSRVAAVLSDQCTVSYCPLTTSWRADRHSHSITLHIRLPVSEFSPRLNSQVRMGHRTPRRNRNRSQHHQFRLSRPRSYPPKPAQTPSCVSSQPFTLSIQSGNCRVGCGTELTRFIPALLSLWFRQSVGTLVTHGKAGVCACISITETSRYPPWTRAGDLSRKPTALTRRTLAQID